MEINIFYSKDDAENQRAVTFVRKAVRNLGIRARIVERDSTVSMPRVVVNGFDLIGSSGTGSEQSSAISYDVIEQALERTAW